MIAGDNHAFIINYEKNAYVWGDNSNGQLGIGTNEIVKTPILHPLLPNKKVKDLKSKGMINLCLLEDGNTLFWPFQKSTGKYILKPVELPLPKNTHISMISCGQNFAMLITKT